MLTSCNNRGLSEFSEPPIQDPLDLLLQIPDGRVMCRQCNSWFKSVKTGRQHVRMAHFPQEFYQCLICNHVVKGKLYFVQHVGKKHFKGGEQIAQNYGRIVSGPPDNAYE